jgi:hypothetical protein
MNYRSPSLFCALLLCALSSADSANVLPAQALTTPPTIDGTINDAEWETASNFEGMVDEETGSPAPEGGAFWIAYDKDYVYFAARLEDKQPGKIKALQYRTNVDLGSDDSIGLLIDPFANNAEYNMFRMNSRGATEMDIAGGRAAKREWIGDFVSRGRVTETGWEVEARIPWAVMKLPPQGNRDLHFNVYRYHSRFQRGYSWQYTSGGRVHNFGKWQSVLIPPPPPNTLKLLPFTYIGQDEDEFIFNSGLDLKAPLNDQIEFVGTINPDFRNVENDILSLDFSYFERLAGETRPFFLEGSDYFTTSYDQPIFTSQRIGTFDIGAKAYGKLGHDTTFGLLNTTDFGNQNSLAFNVKKQIDPKTWAQVAVSSLEQEGDFNDVGFLQYRKQIGPVEYFAQHSYLKDSMLGGAQRNNVGGAYNNGGYNGVLEYTSITENYVPRIGFAPQRGFEGFSGNLGTELRTNGGPLMAYGWGVFGQQWDDFDGDEYLHNYGANGSLTWKDGTDLDFGFQMPSFQGSNDRTYFVNIEYPRGNDSPFYYVGYNWGEIEGEQLRQWSIAIRYRPVERLQLRLNQQWQELGDKTSQTIFSANYDLGDDRAISGRLVKRDDDTNWYLSYRRSGGKGTDFYLIFGDPNARTFQKSLILKVVMPFEIKF